MERRRFAKRRALRLAGAAGASLAAMAALRRLEALSIPSPERFIGPHPDFAADVLVFRDGEEAVAIDSRGREVARSRDHAEAIQAAIDHVASNGGGVVFLKRGVYIIKSVIRLKSNIVVRGEGFSTILKVAHDAAPYKIFSAGYDQPVENIALESFSVDGNKADLPWTGDRAQYHTIDIINANRVVIKRLYLHDNKAGASIVISNSKYILIENVLVENNGEEGNTLSDGIYIGNSSYITVANSVFDTVTDTGVAMDNCLYAVVVGCHFYSCKIQGVSWYNLKDEWQKPRTLIVANNVFYACGRGVFTGWYPDTTQIPERVVIVGNQILGCTKGIRLDVAQKVIIVGNYIGYSAEYNIEAYSASWALVAYNMITDADVGLYLGTGVNEWTIERNHFIAVETPINKETGGTVRIRRNIGYATENRGVATISAGSTKVTVNHSLDAKPSKVLITPLGQPPGKLWVENITDTSFDIVTDTAPSADLEIAWYAEV